MRRARRVDHSLFIYFILTEEADGGGGALLTCILDSSPSVTCSGTLKQSMKLTQLFSFPHKEFVFFLSNLLISLFLSSDCPLGVKASCPIAHRVSTIQIMCQPEEIGVLFSFNILLFLTLRTLSASSHLRYPSLSRPCGRSICRCSLKCGFPFGFVCTAVCKPTLCHWLRVQTHHRYLSFRCLR